MPDLADLPQRFLDHLSGGREPSKIDDEEYGLFLMRAIRAWERRVIENPEMLAQNAAMAQRLAEVMAVANAANAERYAVDPRRGASMLECARILGMSKAGASGARARGVAIMNDRIDRGRRRPLHRGRPRARRAARRARARGGRAGRVARPQGRLMGPWGARTTPVFPGTEHRYVRGLISDEELAPGNLLKGLRAIEAMQQEVELLFEGPCSLLELRNVRETMYGCLVTFEVTLTPRSVPLVQVTVGDGGHLVEIGPGGSYNISVHYGVSLPARKENQIMKEIGVSLPAVKENQIMKEIINESLILADGTDLMTAPIIEFLTKRYGADLVKDISRVQLDAQPGSRWRSRCTLFGRRTPEIDTRRSSGS